MRVVYADTSALVRSFVPDEPEHAALRAQLRESADVVVTSELAAAEMPSALHAAARAGRVRSGDEVIARFDAECQTGGPIGLFPLDLGRLLTEVRRLLASHPLRTLDAVHLASALIDARGLARGAELAMVTRDARQADAARAEGLVVE